MTTQHATTDRTAFDFTSAELGTILAVELPDTSGETTIRLVGRLTTLPKGRRHPVLTTRDGEDHKAPKAQFSAATPEEVAEFEAAEDDGKMTKVLSRYKTRYELSISASGRKSLNNGDSVASILEAKTPEQVMRAAEIVLKLADGELFAKYGHLNNGQKRMNAGNRIRAAHKRGDLRLEDLEMAMVEAVDQHPITEAE